MIYRYTLPRALQRYRGLTIAGQVVYPDHAVEGNFVENLGGLMRRLASEMPARRVPSLGECRFCEITPTDCPDKADEGPPEEGTTDDF